MCDDARTKTGMAPVLSRLRVYPMECNLIAVHGFVLVITNEQGMDSFRGDKVTWRRPVGGCRALGTPSELGDRPDLKARFTATP